jgi:hypothetical protein
MTTDREFLTFIHDRLLNVHHENELLDYMHRLRAIIAKLPADRTTSINETIPSESLPRRNRNILLG